MNKRIDLVINWPTTHFTIQDIQKMYPTARNVTLRFRINREIENGKVVYIGRNPTNVGRPTIVFAPFPVTKETLESAKKDGVILDERFEPRVNYKFDQTPTSSFSFDANELSILEKRKHLV